MFSMRASFERVVKARNVVASGALVKPATAGLPELLHESQRMLPPMQDWIVAADEALVVVDKPSGLPAVPGRPEHLKDSAWSRVQARFADARVVHRIDMPTSGLLLFARGALAQRRLSQAFAAREVHKVYVAIVDGEVMDEAGTIELPIATHWEARPKQRIDPVAGKPSITHWQVLDRAAGRTRLQLRPVTGRSHQLRVHLTAIGHPIVGDALYAPPALHPQAPRLLLHASELALAHPDSGAALHWRRDAPF
jgi:tRNA pseudouridine32 synthase/23S rRNA pseudouridine746 synthase